MIWFPSACLFLRVGVRACAPARVLGGGIVSRDSGVWLLASQVVGESMPTRARGRSEASTSGKDLSGGITSRDSGGAPEVPTLWSWAPRDVFFFGFRL